MVRREALKGHHIPLISPISKVAYFLAEIPSNLQIILDPREQMEIEEDRFHDQSGFIGDPLDFESYLLLARYDGDTKKSVVELVDLRDFKTIYKWTPDIMSFIDNVKITKTNEWRRLNTGNEYRFGVSHPLLFEDGSLLFNSMYDAPLKKIDKNSELLWIKYDDFYHHSNEEDVDGNLWVCSEYYPYAIDDRYTGNEFGAFKDDAIAKIDREGNLLYKKSVSEIFIENEMEYLLFATGDQVFVEDPVHLNDIQPVDFDTKYWKKGDVFLSFRHQSMVMLFRPSTNEIIWKSTGKFYNQHDVDILDDHRISIFDNNAKEFYEGLVVDGNNRIIIYDFEKDEYSSYLEESLIREDVRTKTEGLNEILENGDLYIEETNYGRTLYFNSDGSLRWSHINGSTEGPIFRVTWSRLLHTEDDIQRVMDFLKTIN